MEDLSYENVIANNIVLDSGSSALQDISSSYNVWIGNIVNNSKNGFESDSSSDLTVANNLIAYSSDYGILINADRNNLIGNSISFSLKNGINLTGAYTRQRSSINGNNIYDTNGAAIRVTHQRVSISGNNIYDTRTPSQTYGINESDSANLNIITGNMFQNTLSNVTKLGGNTACKYNFAVDNSGILSEGC